MSASSLHRESTDSLIHSTVGSYFSGLSMTQLKKFQVFLSLWSLGCFRKLILKLR